MRGPRRRHLPAPPRAEAPLSGRRRPSIHPASSRCRRLRRTPGQRVAARQGAGGVVLPPSSRMPPHHTRGRRPPAAAAAHRGPWGWGGAAGRRFNSRFLGGRGAPAPRCVPHSKIRTGRGRHSSSARFLPCFLSCSFFNSDIQAYHTIRIQADRHTQTGKRHAGTRTCTRTCTQSISVSTSTAHPSHSSQSRVEQRAGPVMHWLVRHAHATLLPM